MSETPAVEISGLVKSYGRTTAVAGLSLRAERGRLTAVLGPNGAGKTTTIEVCEGYRRADAGTVRVLGLDPARDAGGCGRGWASCCSQAASRPPRDPVTTCASCPGSTPTRSIRRCCWTGSAWPSRPGRRYRRLSGGQQQRLALAAAIIGRPELIFLDEPTAGLDPQARHATWDLVAGLRAAGATIILTTHYLEEAERLADHVVIVDHGTVVTQGTPAELTGSQGQLRFRAEPGLDTSGLLGALPAASVVEGVAGRRLPGRAAVGVDPQVVATVTAWCAEQGVLAQEPADREQDPRGRLPRADRAGAAIVTELTWPSPGPWRRAAAAR